MSESASENVVVLSKLDIPNCPATAIKRMHFLRELAISCTKKLTCIVAECGYGKHTALAQLTHIVENESDLNVLVDGNTIPTMKVSWLYVDERDNDPAHFWTHILAMFDDAPMYSEGADAYSLLFPLINKRFKNQHLVIFNRIDKIRNREILEDLIHLISDSPQALHFAFSMQVMPECIRGKVYGLCSRWFTHKDLRYSRTETEAQLHLSLGDSFECLTKKDIDDIHAITEGWARGIDLATQAAKTAFLEDEPFVFNGQSPEVNLFFSSRAEARIPAKTLEVLKVLSLVERFNKQLIDDVFADETGGRLSTELIEDEALFLAPCKKDSSWHRFNRLFCDWLQHEATKMPDSQLRSSFGIIGAWFFNNGDSNEVTKYLLMAEDFGYLEGLARSLTGLRRDNEANSFIWLASLDSSQFNDSPLLCILAAWAHNAAGHVEEALFWTEQFVQACEHGGEKYSSVPVDFARRFMTIKCKAMTEGGEDTFEKCEEIIDASGQLEPSLLSTLYQTMGESRVQMGRLADAEDLFLQAHACASVDGTIHQLFFNMFFISEMNFRLGDLDEVEKMCKNLLSNRNVPLVFRSATQALLGLVYTERMDFSLAEPFLKEAREGSSIFQNLDLYLLPEVAQANYLYASGRVSEAYVLIAEAVMRAERFTVPRGFILDAYFYQAIITASRHNVRDLKVITKKFGAQLRDQDAIHKVEFIYIMALLHKEEGSYALAIENLDEALDFATEYGFRLHRARILVTKVSCLYQIGQVEAAKETLYHAIREASVYGYPNTLMGHEKSVENALINYSSSAQASPAIREFIKDALSRTTNEKIQAAVTRSSAPSSGLASLSEREREVVSLLKLGMSRQEISDALCVSINTTKKHLASIYVKLGVSTRAELLDLLPSNF